MNWRLQVSAAEGSCIVEIILYFVFAYGVYGSYKKAGTYGAPAWSAFIPIYNFIVLLKVAGRPITWAWFLLLAIIPFIGGLALFVISIIILHDVSKSFGHGGAFTVGLVIPLVTGLLVHPVPGSEPVPRAGCPGRHLRRWWRVRRRLHPPAGGWLSPVTDRLPGPAPTPARADPPPPGQAPPPPMPSYPPVDPGPPPPPGQMPPPQ